MCYMTLALSSRFAIQPRLAPHRPLDGHIAPLTEAPPHTTAPEASAYTQV